MTNTTEQESVDYLILRLLKQVKKYASHEKELSTYKIAKRLHIAWTTDNINCYKLKSEGKIDGRLEKAEIEEKKKMLWWC